MSTSEDEYERLLTEWAARFHREALPIAREVITAALRSTERTVEALESFRRAHAVVRVYDEVEIQSVALTPGGPGVCFAERPSHLEVRPLDRSRR